MTNDVKNRQPSPRQIGDTEFRRLAQSAIGVLAACKTGQADGTQSRLCALSDAFIAPDNQRSHDALAAIREDGMSADDIIDHMIPATARLLGERWFADDISFADVTIGSARLQETVRALARRDQTGSRQRVQSGPMPAILLVLPRGEDHSLGLIVAADQFRRLGYEVVVAVDQQPRRIAAMVKARRFVMVGISVSGRRTLASARDIVEKIRAMVTRFTPIVLGGACIAPDRDLLTATGADHVVGDARGALRACGLSLAPSVTNRVWAEGQDEDCPAAALRGEQR